MPIKQDADRTSAEKDADRPSSDATKIRDTIGALTHGVESSEVNKAIELNLKSLALRALTKTHYYNNGGFLFEIEQSAFDSSQNIAVVDMVFSSEREILAFVDGAERSFESGEVLELEVTDPEMGQIHFRIRMIPNSLKFRGENSSSLDSTADLLRRKRAAYYGLPDTANVDEINEAEIAKLKDFYALPHHDFERTAKCLELGIEPNSSPRDVAVAIQDRQFSDFAHSTGVAFNDGALNSTALTDGSEPADLLLDSPENIGLQMATAEAQDKINSRQKEAIIFGLDPEDASDEDILRIKEQGYPLIEQNPDKIEARRLFIIRGLRERGINLPLETRWREIPSLDYDQSNSQADHLARIARSFLPLDFNFLIKMEARWEYPSDKELTLDDFRRIDREGHFSNYRQIKRRHQELIKEHGLDPNTEWHDIP